MQYLREENISEIQDFVGESLIYSPEDNEYYIKTLEGNHKCTKGDYIIKGVKNEFYPCKPDIFKVTYEKVDSKYNKEDLIEQYSHIYGKVKSIFFSKVGEKTLVCLIKLENGFEVVGTSACVNPEDFDLEIGEYYSLKNALDKVEELEGYLMQEARRIIYKK